MQSYSLGPPRRILAVLLGRDATDQDVHHYHHVLRRTAGAVRPYPGIVELLEEASLWVPMAVFIGASHTAATLLLEPAGLASHFSLLIGGDQVAFAKPAPDGILTTARRLFVPAERTCYVGDSPEDLRAARAAGSLAAAAGWSHLHTSVATADIVLSHPRDLWSVLAEHHNAFRVGRASPGPVCLMRPTTATISPVPEPFS